MPSRKPEPTPARILSVAAVHIERVGLYRGEHLWKPGASPDSAPCNPLYAWERAVLVNRPGWPALAESWDAFRQAREHSLTVVSDHLNGRPVGPDRWQKLRIGEYAYRRSVLWCWSDDPRRTSAEAAAAFRAAATLCDSDRAHTGAA